ncbi:MAG: M23 family metallopeptidase [Myxococcota bacterium]
MPVARMARLASALAVAAAAAAALYGCPPPAWNLVMDEDLKDSDGVFHTVRKGDTLYRISRAYGVPLQLLAEENDVDDTSRLAVGEKLFIPGAARPVVVPDTIKDPPPKPARQTKPVKKPEQKPAVKQPPRDTTVAVITPKDDDGDETKPRLYMGRFIWPVKGVVVSRFGVRNGTRHQGIDISAPTGTAVVAAADGKVIYSDNKLRGYGNLILIRHSDGFISVYAHNSINAVKEGDTVRRGQRIAAVGATGNAEGPHLHFEIREGSKARNPMFFLQ